MHCRLQISALLCLCAGTLAAADIPAFDLLAEKLGASSFDEREIARQAFLKAGPIALPKLKALVATTTDPEIRLRGAELVHVLQIIASADEERAWLTANLGPIFGARELNVRMPPVKPVPEEVVAVHHSALEDALLWLAENQEADGRWDSRKHGAQVNADIEQTALALTALLASGHTEKVGQHKEVVRRAVAWLSRQVRDDGTILRDGETEPDGLTTALTGMALSEAAGMANKKETRETAQRMVDAITRHQSRDGDAGPLGGFGRRPRSTTPDLLTTAIFTMYLKSAKVAGLKVDHDAFDGLIRFLDSVESPGGFSMRPKQGVTVRATLMGCLCRQFLGWKKEDLERNVILAVSKFQNDETDDVFGNWFGLLCAFQQGGETWQRFNRWSTERLVQRQRRTAPLNGSWDPSGEWEGAGRVMSTAAGALCFEFFYRRHMIR